MQEVKGSDDRIEEHDNAQLDKPLSLEKEKDCGKNSDRVPKTFTGSPEYILMLLTMIRRNHARNLAGR